jgi:hypothetical protein
MEAVLQWIDDAEDLFFAGVFLWQRMIRYCLTLGFVASLALILSRLFLLSFAWVFALTGVAMSSVGLWTIAALTALLTRERGLTIASRA